MYENVFSRLKSERSFSQFSPGRICRNLLFNFSILDRTSRSLAFAELNWPLSKSVIAFIKKWDDLWTWVQNMKQADF